MFKGLFTALITPFKKDGSLDVPGLRILIQRQIQARVDGIVFMGTTGEDPTLSYQEKEKILSIAVEEGKGKTLLIAGTGSYSTQQTIANTQLAKERGMDGALVVTPYYNKPTQEGIFLHFKALTETCEFPILVYNIQGRCGTNIEVATLERIASLPHIKGVKEASGLLTQMMDVLMQIGKNHSAFAVLSGDDIFTYPLMTLGGEGVISVASNLIPEVMKDLVDLCQKGDFQTAQQLHFELIPLFKHLFIETNPIPIKAAMQFFGWPAGECRLPLCPLSEAHTKTLREFLKDLTAKGWLSEPELTREPLCDSPTGDGKCSIEKGKEHAKTPERFFVR